MSTTGFLALAYGLVWAVVAIYVWFVSRRQATLRRQLDGLQMDMNKAEEKFAQER